MIKIITLIIIILISCTAANRGKKIGIALSLDGISKSYLLSAGINDYADAGLSPLKKARNETKGFGKVLRETSNFLLTFFTCLPIL